MHHKKAIRTFAAILTVTVTLLAGAQHRASAMLSPAPTAAPQVSQADRQTDLATIQKALESKLVRERLHQIGLNDAEIEKRLTRLSDAQVHQMASQIRTINPGGDGAVIGILIAVLLVVLIIYLVKRI